MLCFLLLYFLLFILKVVITDRLQEIQIEAIVRRCSVKENVIENLTKFFLIKCRAEACIFIKKESLAQVFFCEFCEINKNTFFHRTPPVDASVQRKVSGVFDMLEIPVKRMIEIFIWKHFHSFWKNFPQNHSFEQS